MKNVRLSYIIRVMGWGLKTLKDKGIGWEGLNFGRTEWLAPAENDSATPMVIIIVFISLEMRHLPAGDKEPDPVWLG